MVETFCVKDRLMIPTEEGLCLSPPKVAVMFMGEAADVGVYFTKQVLLESLQV